MECAEIRSGFVAGRVPAGPPVEEHLERCPHCRELFENGAVLGRRLAQAVLPEVNPGDLFNRVEREVSHEIGLRAKLRAWPTPLRAAALTAVAAVLLLSQLLWRRRADFSDFPPGLFWAVVALLGAALVMGTLRLMRGATAPVRSIVRERVSALLLLIAPGVVLLLVPLGGASSDAMARWGRPGACFSYGAALVAPLLLLYWLFERRDVVPSSALISAGAIAGISANLLLHAHCPSAHLGHLLLGHASIGVVWALVLGLVSKPLQRAR